MTTRRLRRRKGEEGGGGAPPPLPNVHTEHQLTQFAQVQETVVQAQEIVTPNSSKEE
ncbi:MAG: hypothetical protein NVSMB38_33790 [Ktedonobacteraceae bacterium]